MWTEKHRGEFQRRRLCGKSPDECGSQEGGLGVKTTLPSAQEVQAWLGGTQSLQLTASTGLWEAN